MQKRKKRENYDTKINNKNKKERHGSENVQVIRTSKFINVVASKMWRKRRRKREDKYKLYVK